MAVFLDLDNTLIFSHRHDIGTNKTCVELYQGRQVSFMTPRSLELLKILDGKTAFVPTTTRSIEQYGRINLGLGEKKYALVCNGGILLEDGKINEDWYRKSLSIVEPSLGEIQKGMELLKKNPFRKFEIRFIENLFVFTKCENPLSVVLELKSLLNLALVDVLSNNEKIYIVPKNLDKGSSVKRLSDLLSEKIISSGDSEFDISMLEVSDFGIVPKDFSWNLKNKNIIKQKDEKVFSDFVLEKILEYIDIY